MVHICGLVSLTSTIPTLPGTSAPIFLLEIASLILSPHSWVVLTPASTQVGIGSSWPNTVLHSPILLVPGWAYEPIGTNRIKAGTLVQTVGKRNFSFLLNLATLLQTWRWQTCKWSRRGGERNGKMVRSNVWVRIYSNTCILFASARMNGANSWSPMSLWVALHYQADL